MSIQSNHQTQPNHRNTSCRRPSFRPDRRLTKAIRIVVWWTVVSCAMGGWYGFGVHCRSQEPTAAASIVNTGLAPEKIDAELAEIESNTNLDETTKANLIAVLQQAKKTLLQSQANQQAASQFDQITTTAPQRLIDTQAKLAELKTRQPSLNTQWTLAELANELVTAKSQLASATKDSTDLAAEATRRRVRLDEIVSLLATADRDLDEIKSQQSQPAPGNESAAESEARKTLLAARIEEVSSRIASLESEQKAYAVTVESLPASRKLADATAEFWRGQVELLQRANLDKQQSQVQATANDLQQAADALPQALRDLANENLKLADLQKQLLEESAATESRLLEVQSAIEEVKAVQETAKERLAAIGLTEALGVMFRQQKDEAEKLRYRLRPREDLKTKVQEYQLEVFRLEDERSQIKQWLDQRPTVDIAWESSDIEWAKLSSSDAEWVLYRKRLQLIDDTLRSQTDVLRSMLNSDLQRHRLIQLIDVFTAFTDKHLFWTRNAPAFSFSELAVASKAVRWFSSPSGWINAANQIVYTASVLPIVSSVLALISLLTFLLRSRARQMIKREGEAATKMNATFSSTLRALMATVVTALAWPVTLGTFAFLLLQTSAVDPFVRGLGYSLGMVALFVVSRGLLSKVCRDQGLAECHFGWTEDVRRYLRRHLRWYLLLGSIMVIPLGIFHEHPDSSVRIFATRWASTLLFLFTAVFHHLVLRRRSPIYVGLVRANPNSIIYRMRKLLWGSAVLMPVLFAFLAMAGYLETTYRLGRSLQSTFLLLVMLILLFGVLSRWLKLRRRDLARRRAMEERQRRLDEQSSGDTPSIANEAGIQLEKEVVIDIDSLDEQGRQTVVVITSVLGLVAMALIWSDLIPALGYLDDWTLWRVGTGENIESVSLLDIAYAALGVVLMIYLTSVVPRMFELLVHGRTSLDAGARYAVATLLRYVIVFVGALIVLNLLSVPYNQLGWLLAAASVGLGFGLQEIVANFVSGIILLLERPVRVGDVVTIDGTTGIVSRIQMRATTVTNWDRKELVIPNKDLITQKLLNWSLSSVINRLTVNIGVAYGSDPDQVRALLYSVVRSHPEVLADPPPLINFESFGDSSLNFVVRFFLEKLDNRIEVTHQINTGIARALEQAGIAIPFPQRDLHVDFINNVDSLPIKISRAPIIDAKQDESDKPLS